MRGLVVIGVAVSRGVLLVRPYSTMSPRARFHSGSTQSGERVIVALVQSVAHVPRHDIRGARRPQLLPPTTHARKATLSARLLDRAVVTIKDLAQTMHKAVMPLVVVASVCELIVHQR